jgi:hypothetical protein
VRMVGREVNNGKANHTSHLPVFTTSPYRKGLTPNFGGSEIAVFGTIGKPVYDD